MLLAIRFAVAPALHGVIAFGAVQIAEQDHSSTETVFTYLALTSAVLVVTSLITAVLVWRKRRSAVPMAIVHQLASSAVWLGFAAQAITDGHKEDQNFGGVVALIAVIVAAGTLTYLRSSERVRRTFVR